MSFLSDFVTFSSVIHIFSLISLILLLVIFSKPSSSSLPNPHIHTLSFSSNILLLHTHNLSSSNTRPHPSTQNSSFNTLVRNTLTPLSSLPTISLFHLLLLCAFLPLCSLSLLSLARRPLTLQEEW